MYTCKAQYIYAVFNSLQLNYFARPKMTHLKRTIQPVEISCADGMFTITGLYGY